MRVLLDDPRDLFGARVDADQQQGAEVEAATPYVTGGESQGDLLPEEKHQIDHAEEDQKRPRDEVEPQQPAGGRQGEDAGADHLERPATPPWPAPRSGARCTPRG